MRLCHADSAAIERPKGEHNNFTLMALEPIDALDRKENWSGTITVDFLVFVH